MLHAGEAWTLSHVPDGKPVCLLSMVLFNKDDILRKLHQSEVDVL